jgi:hypothetical protein
VGTSGYDAQMSGIKISQNFFSLIRSNGVSKNPTFHTDFKNVHMTLVKSAPKKGYVKKKKFFFNWLNKFLAKTFFWGGALLLSLYVHF